MLLGDGFIPAGATPVKGMKAITGFLAELTCGNDERAEAVVERIVALPPAQVEELLEELQILLVSPEADIRWWATRALAALPDARVVSLLVKVLEDEDASVRQCAALGLRLHARAQLSVLLSQAIPALVTALADNDNLVARLASDALGEIGEAAVPALLEVMQSDLQQARLEAVRALAAIGDQRSIPVLFAALDEDSALMEYWATEALQRMGVGMMYFSPE